MAAQQQAPRSKTRPLRRNYSITAYHSLHLCHRKQARRFMKTASYYDDWGFLPIHIFDTSGRLVLSVLREAATPSGREILTLVKRVVGHIRERFPRVRIRLRGDSHYACPEVMTLRSLCDRVQRTRKRGCAAGRAIQFWS